MSKSLVCLTIIVASSALAQEYRATLSGTVTDPSGAAIPGATVKATNTANHQVSETKTAGAGLFTIPLLEPGVYTVEAVAPGFQTVRQEGVGVLVLEKLNIPL